MNAGLKKWNVNVFPMAQGLLAIPFFGCVEELIMQMLKSGGVLIQIGMEMSHDWQSSAPDIRVENRVLRYSWDPGCSGKIAATATVIFKRRDSQLGGSLSVCTLLFSP